jgi:hypothetical protein
MTWAIFTCCMAWAAYWMQDVRSAAAAVPKCVGTARPEASNMSAAILRISGAGDDMNNSRLHEVYHGSALNSSRIVASLVVRHKAWRHGNFVSRNWMTAAEGCELSRR